MITKLDASGPQSLLDLRPDAVDQHEMYAEAMEQRTILSEARETPIGYRFTAERYDEDFSPVGIDVR
jgi:hypothetical protein